MYICVYIYIHMLPSLCSEYGTKGLLLVVGTWIGAGVSCSNLAKKSTHGNPLSSSKPIATPTHLSLESEASLQKCLRRGIRDYAKPRYAAGARGAGHCGIRDKFETTEGLEWSLRVQELR